MIIKNEKMEKQSRNELKGGKGTISFLNFADCTAFKNCRLISEMTIPVNASIGEHTHLNESEYYIILEGKGTAIDNGHEVIVEKGDLVATHNNETHELRNIGSVPLKVIAFIVTYS